MNAANPLPAAGAPALQSLLNALMNAVVEAVRIDDLTEFDLLLQQTPIDGVEDLAGWLSRNDVAAHRFRRSITTLTVNRAAVELFGAESINQLVEHMNATQYSVSSPNLIGFMTAIRIGATSFSGTFCCHDPQGRSIRVAMETQFVRAESRVLGCHMIRQIDIHHRKRNPLQNAQSSQAEQTQQRLQFQSKCHSLGRLAGGIAHDFNNLLTVIGGHSEILQLQLAKDPAAVKTTEKILHAVRIANALCRQMLTFAGKAPGQLKSVDMNEIATDICRQLRPTLPQGTTLQTRLAMTPAVLHGDRHLLSQLIGNLISNAADATAVFGGRISVIVDNNADVDDIDVSSDEFFAQEDMADSTDWLSVTVTDNGNGIADEVRQEIFDPYFTSSASGKGLGLATVMGITRTHRGAIHVTSRPGQTSFRVFLPGAADEGAARIVSPSSEQVGNIP